MAQFPRQYLEGIHLFNEGKYFEAHEIWEEIWGESVGLEKKFYQALIMVAVALLKRESNIPGGAEKMYQRALERLAELPDSYFGIDIREFEKEFRENFSDSSPLKINFLHFQ